MKIFSKPRDQVPVVQLAQIGLVSGIKELLEKYGSSLDINEQDSFGNFAAIVAARRNDFGLLRFLVENGARLDLKDGRGNTVKDWAIRYENKDMIDFIEKTLAKIKTNNKAM